jgi:hypothetical protein
MSAAPSVEDPSAAPERSLPPGWPRAVCRALAGLETGLAAGIVSIATLLLHSVMRGELWWAKLNVAGGLFFGGAVYSMGFGRATLSGLAVLLLLYTLAGVVYGSFAPGRGWLRNLLTGVAFALLLNFLAGRFLWRRFDSFGPVYYPPLATLPAHLIFGILLSRFAGRFRSISFALGDPSWTYYLREPVKPSTPVPAEPPLENEAPAEPPAPSKDLDPPPES